MNLFEFENRWRANVYGILKFHDLSSQKSVKNLVI